GGYVNEEKINPKKPNQKDDPPKKKKTFLKRKKAVLKNKPNPPPANCGPGVFKGTTPSNGFCKHPV
ncbi:hypothetical protein, partial [Klebsiella pneumoniae]|uniref:hypothetical protein n=1 Tax=Klebsiella pneumoniae TaxID=573 RepID=UPI003013C3F0